MKNCNSLLRISIYNPHFSHEIFNFRRMLKHQNLKDNLNIKSSLDLLHDKRIVKTTIYSITARIFMHNCRTEVCEDTANVAAVIILSTRSVV